MWRWWTCRRLRARLVDVASGTLGAAERREVEMHLAACAGCTSALEALRDIPSLLRGSERPPLDEQFWSTQRQAIMRTVEALPPRPTAEPREPQHGVIRRPRWVAWAPALVAATALLVVVALRPPALWHVAPAPPTADIEGLDDPTLMSLSDLAGVSSPDVEHSIELVSNEPVLPELSDDELDELAELVGVHGR